MSRRNDPEGALEPISTAEGEPPLPRALIVDDDALLRTIVREALAGAFDCVPAASTTEALELLCEGPFALIVADQHLPESSGIELLARSLVLAPDAARILITGSPSIELAQRAVNDAAVDRFYVKPLDAETLRAEAERTVTDRQAQAEVSRRMAALREGADEGRARVLIVEDDDGSLEVFEAVLSMDDHEIVTARSGREALDHLGARACDLIVCDKNLPDGSGLEVLRVARRMHPDLVGIVITAYASTEAAIEALEAGAFDFLRKPLSDINLLRKVVNRALDHQRLGREKQRLLLDLVTVNEKLTRTNASLMRTESRLRKHLDELEALQDATVMGLTRLAEYRDLETGAHLDRMRSYSRLIAEAIEGQPGYERVDEAFVDAIYRAAPLHDIGKVGIPDRILCKPGRLSPAEWEVMRTHPVIGGQTLEEAAHNAGHDSPESILHIGKNIAYYHHERIDGSGYPFGLSGEEIPLEARIVSIADTYDAITSRRVYKPSVPHEKARRILEGLSGVKFEQRLVEAFLAREPEILAIRQRYDDETDGEVRAEAAS
ncbi:MAG: response regulator [Deltaproteobacteria bacterium]|nr:response regulator [Deltaproteobacteria bacterium]